MPFMPFARFLQGFYLFFLDSSVVVSGLRVVFGFPDFQRKMQTHLPCSLLPALVMQWQIGKKSKRAGLAGTKDSCKTMVESPCWGHGS